jgi:hypothetical protein
MLAFASGVAYIFNMASGERSGSINFFTRIQSYDFGIYNYNAIAVVF